MSIYHEELGEGSPVVLVHGFCETREIWKPLKNKLALNYKVYVLDLPGFGKSPLPTSDFTISHIANQVKDWLDANDLREAVMIGHSLGGYVTLALAEQYPEMLLGFGLLHSTATEDDDEKKRSRNKTVEFIEKRGVKVFAEAFVQQLFYRKNRVTLEAEIGEVIRIAADTNEKTLKKYMAAMRDRPDRTSVLSNFIKPILFVAGDRDTSVPLEKAREQFDLIPNPSIHVLHDVGHMGMYEATMQVYQAISSFLEEVYSLSKSNDDSPNGGLPDRDLKRNLGCG